jgi:tubulin polyglutamylase TTLL9
VGSDPLQLNCTSVPPALLLPGGKRILATADAHACTASLSCRSGFARFTNCRFSMKREDITNTFIHLTNVAIQKHAPTFNKDKGMKWPIRSLRLFLNTRHGAQPT